MPKTNLENKIENIIGNIIVALKSKGVENISIKKIVNFISDKYNVVLDNDYVSEILSKTPAVSEINDDKVMIGKAPDAEKDAQAAVSDGMNNASDDTGLGGGFGGGAPMSGGDLGGMPSDEEPLEGEEGLEDLEGVDNMDDAQDDMIGDDLPTGEE